MSKLEVIELIFRQQRNAINLIISEFNASTVEFSDLILWSEDIFFDNNSYYSSSSFYFEDLTNCICMIPHIYYKDCETLCIITEQGNYFLTNAEQKSFVLEAMLLS